MRSQGKNMALAIALQTWGTLSKPGDVRASIELTQLISDLEPEYRADCYWMMMFRRDTPVDLQNICVQNLRQKFRCDGFIARNYGDGWPYGPNQLWMSTMSEAWGRWIEHSKAPRKGTFPYNGLLTMESDCVPLRADWISALTKEWTERVINAGTWEDHEEDAEAGHAIGWPKYEAMGHKEVDHLNGNMIIRPDYLARHRINYTTSDSWDVANKKDFMAFGLDTNLILQHYRRGSIVKDEIPFLIKNGTIPALFHGCKDDVGKKARRMMREILIDGVPV